MSGARRFVSPRFDHWRQRARDYLAREIRPEHIDWGSAATGHLDLQLPQTSESGSAVAAQLPKMSMPDAVMTSRLPQMPALGPPVASATPAEKSHHSVPAHFLSLARHVACHTAEDAPALMYLALWRLTHGERHLFQLQHDPAVRTLKDYDQAISREIHKTHAFVRFRRIELDLGSEQYVAWFEPRFPVIEPAMALFVERFANMEWSVLSPWVCAHWRAYQLTYTTGVDRCEFTAADNLETLWRTYYRSIFNPARLKTAAMTREMPVRFWKNLPESADIHSLTSEASPRMLRMIEDAAK